MPKLEAIVSPSDFQLWLAPLSALPPADGTLELVCPNQFHLRQINERFLPLIREVLRQQDPAVAVQLQVSPPGEAAAPAAADGRGHQQMNLPHLNPHSLVLNHRYRFEYYVAGGGNELACAAAQALAANRNIFTNTLFLVSTTGLGKSHLTQAVGHQVLGREPGAKVAYLTAEDFTNQMIRALKAKKMDQFKERFRNNCDILLLEEVQFLSGKDKTQDELGYTLDALSDAGKKIIFTGTKPPDQIGGLKSHILSRLGSGLTVPIEPPNHSARVRILREMAQRENFPVEQEVLEFLAQEISDDIRRLQSALVSLLAKSSLTGRGLDLHLAAEVVGAAIKQLRRVNPGQIRDAAAQVFGLPVAELTGKSRKKHLTRARNVAMYLCRRHTDASYAAIGREFNRDHATVMYGVGQVERGLDQEPKLAQEVAFLEKRLGLGA
ncbi:MAG: chromosomal replication initiator protein DnaA [Deltaproteobacteria bacterium]|nr:chromosomal replication initiator protein DnaA [Deltaproteobacteria bacterium]